MNKTNYIERRKKNLRGQGDLPQVNVYPKGEKVVTLNSKGEQKELPNSRGTHLVRIPGQGLINLNRVESRRKSRSTPATKKNFAYQQEKVGFYHDTRKPKMQVTKTSWLSNHMRHRERQIARELRKKDIKQQNG